MTRYRYGDEAHLEEALDKIFRFGKSGGLPRKSAPVLVGVREEVSEGRYALVLEFESKLEWEKWEEKQTKFQTFFGPGGWARGRGRRRGCGRGGCEARCRRGGSRQPPPAAGLPSTPPAGPSLTAPQALRPAWARRSAARTCCWCRTAAARAAVAATRRTSCPRSCRACRPASSSERRPRAE